MNIYLLEISFLGLDTYDAAIVIADNEQEAKTIHPIGDMYLYSENGWVNRFSKKPDTQNGWENDLDNISVTLIGVADKNQEKGVILASFNAG